MHNSKHTLYSSIKSVKYFTKAVVEFDGWDPSESEENEIILSRSSKIITEGE